MASKIVRILFLPLLLGWIFFGDWDPNKNEPLSLYATDCDDSFEKIFCRAIEKAKSSIDLSLYALSDAAVIDKLNKKAAQGISITLLHDTTSPQVGFSLLDPRIKKIGCKQTGLMHRKIVIIDEKELWIGSANFTAESLRMHDNLIAHIKSKEMARALHTQSCFKVESQEIECYLLPEKKEIAMGRLQEILGSAQKSIKIAMFTWTSKELTQAVIAAKERGVAVEVAIDGNAALGSSKEVTALLQKNGIPVRISKGARLLHHKFAYIDGEKLILGSANWTKAAFSQNRDCFIVISDINSKQKKKMESLWRKVRCMNPI